MTAPEITIFVRHSAACKYAGDEFARRCDCRKHLRWTAAGKQHRAKTGCRAWADAERVKRDLEDQLAGKTATVETKGREIRAAVEVFIEDKKVQGVTAGVISKYTLELGRLRDFAERSGLFTVQALDREFFTRFCATWPKLYPSSQTRVKVKERVGSFLQYGYESRWFDRVPKLPRMTADERPTMPLDEREFERLLDAIPKTAPHRIRKDGRKAKDRMTPRMQARIRALFLLMRYSGLAIGDALTLPRTGLKHDTAKGLYKVVTARQKTGTDVSVAVPPFVAAELQALENDAPAFFFWSGEGDPNTIGKTWATRYIRPCFETAKLDDGSHMVSHRLRDTFAVELLQRGVPLEEVSTALGHRSIKTTQKSYAKWVKGRQDRLDELVRGTW